MIDKVGVQAMHDRPQPLKQTLIDGCSNENGFGQLSVGEITDDVDFVHVSAPLAAVMTRLAESLAPVGAEEILSNADFLGLVDFHQTSSPTERTSSPLACSAHSGRGRKAAPGPA